MASKVWRGFLQFGLLNIPVYLNVAARDKRIELHTYHSVCKGSLKHPKFCPACDRIIPDSEILKGYEAGDGIVPITKEELDAITPETGRVMEISECVKWSDVDPVFLAESYFLLPDPAGAKAYSLLAKVLTDTGRVGIAQVTKNGREHVAILRPKDAGLMLHYLWYDAEVARVPEFENLPTAKLSADEIKLAKQLVESLDSEFEPEKYSDHYAERVNILIASKLDKKIAPPAPVKDSATAPVQDLMSALKQSLGQPKRKIVLDEPLGVKVSVKKSKKKVA